MLSGAYVKCEVKSMNLSSWKDNIPYGGLLAVKEAEQKGISGFRIYYPAKRSIEDRVIERIKNDPVITGMYNGVECQIFAWDDRNVYE